MHDPSPSPDSVALRVAQLPWVFTQHNPADTDDFARLAKERGFDLDTETLQVLHRHRLLSPFVALRSRPEVLPSTATFESEHSTAGTRLTQLRAARGGGQLIDPAAGPSRRLSFVRPAGADWRWWNGLLYSYWQLLLLPLIGGYIRRRTVRWHDKKKSVGIPKPDPLSLDGLDGYLRIVAVVTAIEARYLPSLDPEWVRLSGTSAEEWERYRVAFDPPTMAQLLDISAPQLRSDAESLLSSAHHLDPYGPAWSALVRRSPPEAWKKLKGAALLAIDLRVAAEMLLRFYEDLADAGKADPLPDLGRENNPTRSWHPLVERLSFREESLDRLLMDLGISPHPRVVLAIEGDTEQAHIPKLWEALEYPYAPELIRVIKLGGVDKDPVKLGALAASPLVARRDHSNEFYWLIKPPTKFLIAVDPEGRYYGDAEKVRRTREKIMNEIRDVVTSQEAAIEDAELENLVEIRTWDQSCYEFAHFSDEELAEAIMAVHLTVNGLNRGQLIVALGATRRRRKDIKEVWSQWSYEVSKKDLANALWPALKATLERIRAGSAEPIPQIVSVLEDSYLTAQRWRYNTVVIKVPKT